MNDLARILNEINRDKIAASGDLRAALITKGKWVFCLIARARLEGRSPPRLDWTTTFDEFLSSPNSLDAMRRLGQLEELLSEFAIVLNDEKAQIETLRESLRTLNATPLLVDYAWKELYKSNLKGMSRLLGNGTSMADIELVLEINSVILNPVIAEALNGLRTKLGTAVAGRKNLTLARRLLQAFAPLPGSPWEIPHLAGNVPQVDTKLMQEVIGRFVRRVPSPEKMRRRVDEEQLAQSVEDLIISLEWPFTRHYLKYLATVHEVTPDMLELIVGCQEPMGKVNPGFIIYCLEKGIRLPLQILQSTIGTPQEYVLDLDTLESTIGGDFFESDCIQLKERMSPSEISLNHYINARSGIRLDEVLSGPNALVRYFLEREGNVPKEMISAFLRGIVVSPHFTTAIKKQATRILSGRVQR